MFNLIKEKIGFDLTSFELWGDRLNPNVVLTFTENEIGVSQALLIELEKHFDCDYYSRWICLGKNKMAMTTSIEINNKGVAK